MGNVNLILFFFFKFVNESVVFEYLLSHTVPAMLLLSCTFLKTHLSIPHFKTKLHSSLARVLFEQGSLFHKVLSFKTNGLSCTCVLIKCKFWVLVAKVFFFFYISCRLLGEASDHPCGSEMIPSLLQGSNQDCWVFIVWVCMCVFSWYYFRWLYRKLPQPTFLFGVEWRGVPSSWVCVRRVTFRTREWGREPTVLFRSNHSDTTMRKLSVRIWAQRSSSPGRTHV